MNRVSGSSQAQILKKSQSLMVKERGNEVKQGIAHEHRKSL